MRFVIPTLLVLLAMTLSGCGKIRSVLIPADIAAPCPPLPPLAVGDNVVDKYFEVCEMYSICATKHNALEQNY